MIPGLVGFRRPGRGVASELQGHRRLFDSIQIPVVASLHQQFEDFSQAMAPARILKSIPTKLQYSDDAKVVQMITAQVQA